MENLELPTPYNDIVLPNAWDIENKSFINIDSSGLKVSYTDPDENKAIIIRANHPIPLKCGIFYFEIKIKNKGKNGMIGVGYCTKKNDKEIDGSNIKTDYIYNMLMPGQENGLWGCGYHGDDGNSFCSGSGEPYGPTYTVGDIIGCYLNFLKKIIFYTKNGVNLGIACHLPDDFKKIIYPCVGFKSQGGSVEVNFGRETFKYSAMTYEDISKISNNNILTRLKDIFRKKSNNILILKDQEKVHFIMGKNENVLVNLTGELTKSLEKKQISQGQIFFLMGEYYNALETLTKLLEIEPDNIMALRYRGEIYYVMKKYKESIADLKKLLEIKPNDKWATKAIELVKTIL
ncbi:concanavalin A-like lectin/glucanase domain-containing protein [Gigaspora rosea]|uniref:Concanavalin A-like lectin/glucanase domain-containing protein n=1 Tax=Gigaspora rosea TaxID=44941 RepID=A0A397W2D1_9GLOM|nr:concanavalin A-like lectin/glucanase domain-containing protein [Gigaspora rosea]